MSHHAQLVLSSLLRDVTDLVEYLSGIHKALDLIPRTGQGLVAHACNFNSPDTGKMEAKGSEVEAVLAHETCLKKQAEIPQRGRELLTLEGCDSTMC